MLPIARSAIFSSLSLDLILVILSPLCSTFMVFFPPMSVSSPNKSL